MRQIDKEFDGKLVRIIEKDEKYFYVLTDICKVMGLTNPSEVRKRLYLHSIRKFTVLNHNKNRRMMDTICVDQNGLIEAVSNSFRKNHEFKNEFLVSLGVDPRIVVCVSRSEEEFSSILSSVIEKLPVSLLKQKRVSQYYVDMFIPEVSLAIEYDERDHRTYCELAELKREKKISSLLECEFVRISDKDSHLENVSIVLSKVFEIFNRRGSIESTYKSIRG